MTDSVIGILGARSFVAESLFSISEYKNTSFYAFSRGKVEAQSNNIQWQVLTDCKQQNKKIKHWLCLAPIWVLPNYFPILESYNIKRIVVLSSTSRFSKINSSDAKEQRIAKQLIDAEKQLSQWAIQHNIEWIILRPTLIYGLAKDKNISTIVNFIKHFGFFPLFGAAKGKRQPIHAEDVAKACMQALNTPSISNQAYNITGQETLAYDEMVKRIFDTLEKKQRLFHFPLSLFRIALKLLNIFPPFKSFSVAMAERMNQDLVFDDSNAKTDFNFSPRPFKLEQQDII